jgi:trehalose 6-phosphate synthase
VGKRREMIVVSNRGPVTYEHGPGQELETKRGEGGLVTALGGLASRHQVTWIASAMSDAERELAEQSGGAAIEERLGDSSYRLRLLAHEHRAYDLYYTVIANPTLWFVQHHLWDLIQEPDRRPEKLQQAWMEGYVPINATFAEAVTEELSQRPDAVVFFNDYHLYLAPRLVRRRVPGARLLQFVHIPWPEPECWRVLPEPIPAAIHDGLLASDMIGFHTDRWRRNFLASAEEIVGAHARGEDVISYGSARTRVSARAISVDPAELAEMLSHPSVLEWEREILEARPEFLVVRVDRTDPSKNIVRGFQAFALFLERHPELHRHVSMLSCLAPSRLDIPEYEDYLGAIQREAESVNERFRQPGWLPIELQIEDDVHQSIAAFKQYDALFVNALYDGLNLVAKEAPLANERDGVLILSENTGACEELGRFSLIIDPLDVPAQAEAIYQALTMDVSERHRRIEELRACVCRRDLSWWIDGLLGDLDHSSSERERNDPATGSRKRR